MTNIRPGRRAVASLLLAALAVSGGALSPSAATAAARTVRGVLLPVPAAGPGEQLFVNAVDVSPLGIVAGTARVVTTAPDGTPSTVEQPQRWAKVPRAGWLRQRLALPAGATSGTVAALTDLGEAGGAVTFGGVSRAVRWSVDGRSATTIGGDRSRVTAAGPYGPWGVFTAGTDALGLTGESELVTRGGVRTPLNGTPELATGYRRTAATIGGPGVAVVWVVVGIGRGTTARPVLWQDGATAALRVVNSTFLEPGCASRVLADGSVVTSGFVVEAGVPSYLLIKHTGGVPGTDVVLNRASASGERVAGIICATDQSPGNLAPDGGIAGYVSDPAGRRAAYWNPAGVLTEIPLAPGEIAATGMLAGRGGRVVVQAEATDGSTHLSYWHNGTRTQLPAPAGWTVTSVVELTGAGLLIANAHNAAGDVRPVAWAQLP